MVLSSLWLQEQVLMGTDGTDFSHRERVATRYQASAETKPKLKRILQVQTLCAVVCFAIGLLVKYDFPSLLCFAGYLIGIPLCYLALNQNNVTYINPTYLQYVYIASHETELSLVFCMIR